MSKEFSATIARPMVSATSIMMLRSAISSAIKIDLKTEVAAMRKIPMVEDQSSVGSTGKSNVSKTVSQSESDKLEAERHQLLVAKCARVLFLAYPSTDYDDPTTAAASYARILEDFSPFVVKHVTDPKTGLQRTCKFPPRISELVSRCEYVRDKIEILTPSRIDWLKRDRARIAREREQQRLIDANRPTHEELKAKYGENWGLNVEHIPTQQEIEAKDKRDRLRQRLFENICEAHGLPRNSIASPFLIEANQKALARDKAIMEARKATAPSYADEGS